MAQWSRLLQREAWVQLSLVSISVTGDGRKDIQPKIASSNI